MHGPGRHLEGATEEELDRWRDLEGLAAAEGTAWAMRSCDELLRQGRSIAGGWPGTLSQARLRLAMCMHGRSVQPVGALSAADLDWLARTLYLSAKSEWLARAEPGGDE